MLKNSWLLRLAVLFMATAGALKHLIPYMNTVRLMLRPNNNYEYLLYLDNKVLGWKNTNKVHPENEKYTEVVVENDRIKVGPAYLCTDKSGSKVEICQTKKAETGSFTILYIENKVVVKKGRKVLMLGRYNQDTDMYNVELRHESIIPQSERGRYMMMNGATRNRRFRIGRLVR